MDTHTRTRIHAHATANDAPPLHGPPCQVVDPVHLAVWFGSYDKRLYRVAGSGPSPPRCPPAPQAHAPPSHCGHQPVCSVALDGSVIAAVVLHPRCPDTAFACTTAGTVYCVRAERSCPEQHRPCPCCGLLDGVTSLAVTWAAKLGGPVFGSPLLLTGPDASLPGPHGPSDRSLLLVPCADGSLYGVCGASGAVAWSVACGAPVFSSPVELPDPGPGCEHAVRGPPPPLTPHPRQPLRCWCMRMVCKPVLGDSTASSIPP